MKEAKSGIYCIENVENGKKYIGKGKNVEERMWNKHKKCAAIGSAIKKYDKYNLIRYVIEYCEEKDLVFWEQYYIREWNTKAPNGYNLTDGGDGANGVTDETRKRMSIAALNKPPMTDKTRKLLSETHSGENHPLYGKRGEDSPNYGKRRTKEQKKKISESKQGIKHPLFGKKFGNPTSQYFGIRKTLIEKKYIYWRACIRRDNKYIDLGNYKLEIDAAIAYDKYVIENNLPNPLNFPTEKDFLSLPFYIKRFSELS